MAARKRQFKTIRKVRKLIPRGKKQKRQLEIFGGLTVALCAVLISALAFAPALQKVVLRSPQTAAVVSAVLTDLLNNDRTANNLGSLTVNPKLVAAAQAKADDMAQNSYFAHTSPEGKDSWYWFKQNGYAFNFAGENLAVDFSESGDVERAWMNSPSHRENILNPNFKEIGIATAVGMYQGRLTVFAVQMFGSESPNATQDAPVQVVSSPQNPEEIALAQTAPSNGPQVLAQEASSGPATLVETKPAVEALAPKPKPAHVAVAPKPQTASVPDATEPSAQPVSVAAMPVAQDPADSVAAQKVERPVGAIRSIPWWGYVLSFPRTALMWAYIFLALLIAVGLGYVTEMEFHIRHFRHASSAAFLFGLMGALFVVSQYVFFVQPVLAAVQ